MIFLDLHIKTNILVVRSEPEPEPETQNSVVAVDLPAGVSVEMESVTMDTGMSSLQEMIDNIQSNHDQENLEEVIEEINMEQIGDGSILQEVTTTSAAKPLFRDYNIDDIIRAREEEEDEVAEVALSDEEDQNSDLEDSDESSDEEELAENFHSLVDLNVAYTEHLKKVLVTLQRELLRNQERQRQIDVEIHDLISASGNFGCQPRSQHRIITRRALSVFASPYFKDQNIYFPPPNEDTKKKKTSYELDVWIDYPKRFSEEDRKKLKCFVREDALRMRSSRLKQEIEKLRGQFVRLSGEDPEKELLAGELRKCDEELENIDKLSSEELFTERWEEYDWDKISTTDFKGSRSPRVCQLQWQNRVHPSINSSSFSPDEDKLLKQLAEALNSQDWDSIAKEMDTGRTPIACFVRFMTRHCIVVDNRRFEKSEDDRLRRLVAHSRINKFIPWQKVAYYMERRTKDQCYQRFVFNLRDNIRRGPYSDVEDMVLVMGEKLYGNDWKKINEILPTRTPIQLHCRWNHFIRGDHRAWTEEEDRTLLEQIKEHGLRDWVVISQELSRLVGDRTRNQCRQRFQFIYKSFKRNPGLGLANIEYKDDNSLARKRYEELYSKLREKYQEWRAEEDKVNPPDLQAEADDVQIELASGLSVSRKVVGRFVSFVRQSLPPPPPPEPLPALERRAVRTLPGHEEELFNRPLPRPSASKNLLGGKKRKIKGYDHRKFKPYRARRGTRNRERLGQNTFKTQTERNIAKFFRPTWILKNKMNFCLRFSQQDLDMLVSAGQGLGKIININKIPWMDLSTDSSSEKQNQLLQSFRDRQLDSSRRSTESQLLPPISAPKAVRTYGRKVKQSDSRAATPSSTTSASGSSGEKRDTINLVPPCEATLVGFRGLLLRGDYLTNPNNNLGSFKGEKDAVDETLRRGTDNPDLTLSGAAQSSSVERTAAHQAADQLLVKRFIQMFFWPAKMSTVSPPRQENVFSDNEDQ